MPPEPHPTTPRRPSDGGPLRLALTTIEYPPDPLSSGIGSYTKATAELLTARGHTVFVVARGSERDRVDDEDGVIVHRLTPDRPQLPATFDAAALARLLGTSLRRELRYRRNIARTLRHLVDAHGVQLIEAAEHLAEPLMYDPRSRPQVPFVVRLHTPLAFSERIDPNIPEAARRGVWWLERRLLQRATHLSAPSAVAAQAFLREFGLSRPVAVYPNPPTYPLTLHAPGNEDPDLLLFVGRVTRWKGAHLLMQALPRVAAAHPRVRLELVGSDHVTVAGYPSMRAYLLSLLPPEHHHRVTFTGFLPHAKLAERYRRAAVCVFPSLFEAFGYTCLEAMTFGKAIVGSRMGGMVELLDDGRAGLLFTPPEVDELAAQIVRLLADPALRRELGERARTRVLEQFDQQVVIEQAEAFYRRAVSAIARR